MEARAIVRQAMAILTPAVPARMEDGHQMLTHWTRKIIVEEGHTVPQLVHILHLIVQHFRVSWYIEPQKQIYKFKPLFSVSIPSVCIWVNRLDRTVKKIYFCPCYHEGLIWTPQKSH